MPLVHFTNDQNQRLFRTMAHASVRQFTKKCLRHIFIILIFMFIIITYKDQYQNFPAFGTVFSLITVISFYKPLLDQQHFVYSDIGLLLFVMSFTLIECQSRVVLAGHGTEQPANFKKSRECCDPRCIRYWQLSTFDAMRLS